MICSLRFFAACVVLSTSARAADVASGETRCYHITRAMFRCPGMNRGLAFDGEHFWVGVFGGWVRCYDRDGRPVPSRDLGGGTVQYLGHGTAAWKGCVATGARDFVAVLPKEGGPMRRLTPPVSGATCAVAATGTTLWAMNHETPVLFEMDLEGRLLRKITTAQRPSSSSRDICVDCDGHVYVLDGDRGDNRMLLEYSPEGKLLRTHQLALSATAVAMDPNDSEKTLHTVSFTADPIVYEYRLAPGEPQFWRLPTLVKPLRYRPADREFAIENGPHRFNRPLYGSNTAFFVQGGDLPEFLLSLPGKGGTLRLGIAHTDAAKWLPEADRVVARYAGGAMHYQIHDTLLGDGRLDIDAVPLPDTEGVVLRITASEDVPALEFVWAFGGASGFNQLNLDTCGYCPESACWLKPEDCENNRFIITKTGFELLAPCHKSRPMVGTVPANSILKVADADKLSSPKALLATDGDKRPILVGRRGIDASKEFFLAVQWRPEPGATIEPAELPTVFTTAKAHQESIAGRVRITVPDPFLNPAAAAICSAADGLWDPPTYAHGGVRWHHPYLGWRAAYIASIFGWHDRARTHFRTFAEVQLKEPQTGKPHADEERHLARQATDSVLYTRGYIPVFPEPGSRGPYDMQQVYIDQLLWHGLWTGDLDFLREMWPVLTDHLDWEKRCFDADGDGLYENFANTLISDAHHYSGGACTQASAYNYRAFLLAARLAKLIGKDPEPYDREARKILAAMNKVLWMPERGWFAEYRDLLGLKRLHPSAELPSIYHPIDSSVPDMFQAHQMLRYVDTAIEHVPVAGDSMTLWTSNWVPWIWSVRDVMGSEVAHTALAYWQAGRRQKAYQLYRGAILDAMYCSRVPGACQGTSEHSRRNAGVASDFSCSVAMFGRTLVEGLFGIVPDALAGELLIRPGLPERWESASIDTPDVGYTYTWRDNTESLAIRSRFPAPMRLRLRTAARTVHVAGVLVNGQNAKWQCVPQVGEPVIEVLVASADGANIRIRWEGPEPARVECTAVVGLGETITVQFGAARPMEIRDPQKALAAVTLQAASLRARTVGRFGHRTVFVRVEQGDLSWWVPVEFEVRPPLELSDPVIDREADEVQFTLRNNTGVEMAGQGSVTCAAVSKAVPLYAAPRSRSVSVRIPAVGLVPGRNPIVVDLGNGRVVRGTVVDWRKPDAKQNLNFECVNMAAAFNDRITQIFENEYRSPRSPYCSLQMPLHGFGDWCYGGRRPAPKIDDSALRSAAGERGRFLCPQGIPFATPGPGDAPNVVFVSQWDNYADTAVIPLAGHARHAWLLVAGSTHPMHSQLDNGEIRIVYTDGQSERLPLHNPTTWWPIEADYQLGIDGFCVPPPHPPRIDLGSGRATLLDLPLDPSRELRSLTVRCLANEVVVGLMSATLLRP